ncbi:hypothetical protein SAMN04487864_101159 [Succiniclasticum ruminis]|uniref:Uncharacterized protein n=2 Tax=Succiniclasticum ruminis TaxID=40841 RepID=A0A1G6HR68_9FIRM|nr:hypothetical protein SAMN04487864_101159 [Succiniclasticum ruminis]
MRLTLRDRLAENAVLREKCLHGTDFLENLIFCGGRAVIVKGKFDAAGREENKLIFMTIRPYNEIIKTLPKICDQLIFPVDALWKVRLMEKAAHKETFYIIGHIKVIYENGRPKGTLVLAPDVFMTPILTENQFEACYADLRDRCYKWPHLGETRISVQAIAKRIPCTSVTGPGKKRYGLLIKWKKVSRGIARYDRKTQIKGSNSAAGTESLPQNESCNSCTLPGSKTGSLLDQSIRKASKLSFTGVGPKKEARETPTPGELQLLKEWIEGQNDENNTDVIIKIFNSPLGLMWLREFGTTKTKIELAAGCKCQFANGIIQIDSDTEKWQIRYSRLLEQIVLYHKNKKDYRINTDREPVEGYHIQHIQSLLNLGTDEMNKFRKPQKECNAVQDYKGEPTIREFLDYIRQHKELAIQRNTREKRKRKDVNNVLRDKNVKHEVKQRKRKRLRNKIKHEKARDVLQLLKQLKEEAE